MMEDRAASGLQRVILAHNAQRSFEKMLDDKVKKLRKQVLFSWQFAKLSLVDRAMSYRDFACPMPGAKHFTLHQYTGLLESHNNALKMAQDPDKIVKKREAELNEQKKTFVKGLKSIGMSYCIACTLSVT